MGTLRNFFSRFAMNLPLASILLVAASNCYSVKSMVRYQVVPQQPSGDSSHDATTPLESLATAMSQVSISPSTVRVKALHTVKFHASLKDRKESDHFSKLEPLTGEPKTISPQLKRVDFYVVSADNEVNAWQEYPTVTPPDWSSHPTPFQVRSGQAHSVFSSGNATKVLAGLGYTFSKSSKAKVATVSGDEKPSLNRLRFTSVLDDLIKAAKEVETRKKPHGHLQRVAMEKGQLWRDHVILDDLSGCPLKRISLLMMAAPAAAEEPIMRASLLGPPQGAGMRKSLSSEYLVSAGVTTKVVSEDILVGFEYSSFATETHGELLRWDLLKEKIPLVIPQDSTPATTADVEEEPVETDYERQRKVARMKRLSETQHRISIMSTSPLPSPTASPVNTHKSFNFPPNSEPVTSAGPSSPPPQLPVPAIVLPTNKPS